MDIQNTCACPVGATQPTFTSLKQLLDSKNLLLRAYDPQEDLPITGAACDSRCVRGGNIFFCKGRAFKPAYLTGALQAGAIAFICDEEHEEELVQAAPGTPALVISDMRKAMAYVSAAAFEHPDRDLPHIGLTGTKGKSTTAYMLRSIIDAANGPKTCGIIGSIDTYDGIEDIESTNTTPEAPDLWRHLANARDAKLAAMVMEVSSQALKYDRTLGLELDVAAFLNIGTDHISAVEHPTFEDYFASKLKIFTQCKKAVVNLDTTHLDRVLSAARQENFAGEIPELICISAKGPDAIECGSCDMVFPDIWATDVKPAGTYLTFTAHLAAEEFPVKINFPGLFNVENALTAIACAKLVGISSKDIAAGLEACRVPGRMELIGTAADKVLCVVDYAHNTLSYQKFFSSMAEEFPERRIIALIGAPGGKAFERRVDLPREAAKWACHIVTTEEDPARESNEAICAEMDTNVPEGATLKDGTAVTHEYVLDREEAVARCLDVALSYEEPSLVCLLGKGDETLIHRGDEFQPMVPDGEAFINAAKVRGLSY